MLRQQNLFVRNRQPFDLHPSEEAWSMTSVALQADEVVVIGKDELH